MKLVSKESYERRYPEEGVDIDKQPLFYIKKFTVSETAVINDTIFDIDDSGKVRWLGGTAARLKIKYALTDWKNVTNDKGEVVPCNDDNKNQLPQDIVLWLVKEIDKLNGINLKMPEQERKNFS